MSCYPNWTPLVGPSQDVPEGVTVWHPRSAKHCMGVVTHLQGSGKLTRPIQCRARHRPGKLTCRPHDKREPEAQAFKKELASAAE